MLTHCRCAQPTCVYAGIRMITHACKRSCSPCQSLVDCRNMKMPSIDLYLVIGLGSAALAAAVALPKPAQIFCKELIKCWKKKSLSFEMISKHHRAGSFVACCQWSHPKKQEDYCSTPWDQTKKSFLKSLLLELWVNRKTGHV